MVNSPFYHNSPRAGSALPGRYARTMALKPAGLQAMESDGPVWEGLLPSPNSTAHCWTGNKSRAQLLAQE